MAFPTNATVIDNFNRANGSLGSSWTDMLSALAISASTATGPGAADGLDGWSATTFGPDVEVYVDISTRGSNGQALYIDARATTLDLNADGYAVGYTVVSGANNDTVGINRIDNGAFTLLGSSITLEFAAGDGLGIECIGSTIKAYRRSAGNWSDISSGGRSDSNYGAAGYALLGIFSDTYRIDNFSGGTVIPAAGGGSALPVFMRTYRQHRV